MSVALSLISLNSLISLYSLLTAPFDNKLGWVLAGRWIISEFKEFKECKELKDKCR